MTPGGTLYVVATPLGNLDDLSPRAAMVLRGVDVVAAEDTRRTRTLLNHVQSSARLVSFHAHSGPRRAAQVLEWLEDGQSVALVSDAGTPGISDPGEDLVRQAREAGFLVAPVPGPSAVAAALSAAGLPADRYIFLGFIPRKGPERRALLEQAAESRWTVVFFESALRLVGLLDDLAARCGGDRAAVVARELTKVHEEINAGTLHSLGVYYREHPPRGEVTLVLEGARLDRDTGETRAGIADALEQARALLAQGQSRRDVAAQLAAQLGLPRNEAYRLVTGL